jgi:streptogramin lyase
MHTTHTTVAFSALATLLLTLGACGDDGNPSITDGGRDSGGGRDADSNGDATPGDDANVGRATLEITVPSPPEMDLAIAVTGPEGFQQTLTEAGTLEDLVPGEYTVSAANELELGALVDTVLEPTVTPESVTVQAGDTGTVEVTYDRHPSSGHLWIAAGGDGELRAYSDDTLQSPDTATPDRNATTINGDNALAFDGQGNLWVANSSDDSLRMYAPQTLTESDPSADVTLSGAATTLDGPHGLAIGTNGGLWVANALQDTVLRFAPEDLETGGALTPDVVLEGSAIEAPEALAFDGDGDLWVVMEDSTSIIELGSGQLGSSAEVTPSTNVTVDVSGWTTRGLAFDLDGNLWVSDVNQDALHRIAATDLETTATVSPEVTLTLPDLTNPGGFAFDHQGNLWVTNTSGGEVMQFDSSDLSSDGAPDPAATIDGIGSLQSPVPAFYPPSPALPLPRPEL